MDERLKIPRIVRIGTTGPRNIENEDLIRKKIVEILDIIDTTLKDTPHMFVAVSPLSPGSDTIITDVILNYEVSNPIEENRLEVILQTDEEEHIKTAQTPELMGELLDFLERAKSKRKLENILKDRIYETRADYYQRAGQVVVDECDILIALWDDKKKGGDTAKIVEFARENVGRSIFIINPFNGVIIKEENDDHILKNLSHHDIYNLEEIGYSKIINAQEEDFGYVAEKIESLNIPADYKKTLYDNFFVQLVRADLLAIHYQSRHLLSVNLVYYFSGLAVVLVTFKVIFLTSLYVLLIFEAIFMITILYLLSKNRSDHWHRKWLDYRYLAERLRNGLLFAAVGLECRLSEHLPHLRSHNDWTSEVYQWIHLKQREINFSGIDFDDLKKFIMENWIDDQITYFQKKSTEHWKKHQNITLAIYLLFAGAFIGALLHSIWAFLIHGLELPLLSKSLSFIAIVFPALAATLAGIRIQHEYIRNAKRFTYMAIYFRKIKYEIEKSTSIEKLIPILEKTNEMALREQQDWRALFAIHEPEPP